MKEKENFIKTGAIRPIIQKEKTSQGGPTFGKSRETHPEKIEPEKEGVISFSVNKEITAGKISVSLSNSPNYHGSKNYDFTLSPNVKPGAYDLIDDFGWDVHVNDKDPWLGIKSALERVTGKDIKIIR